MNTEAKLYSVDTAPPGVEAAARALIAESAKLAAQSAGPHQHRVRQMSMTMAIQSVFNVVMEQVNEAPMTDAQKHEAASELWNGLGVASGTLVARLEPPSQAYTMTIITRALLGVVEMLSTIHEPQGKA